MSLSSNEDDETLITKYKPQPKRVKALLKEFENKNSSTVIYACPRSVHQYGVGSVQDKVSVFGVYVYDDKVYKNNNAEDYGFREFGPKNGKPKVFCRFYELRNLLSKIKNGDTLYLKDILYGQQYGMRIYGCLPIFRAVIAKAQCAFSPYHYYQQVRAYGENALKEMSNGDTSTAFRRFAWSVLSQAVMRKANWHIPMYRIQSLSKEFIKEIFDHRPGLVYRYLQRLPKTDNAPTKICRVFELVHSNLSTTNASISGNNVTTEGLKRLFKKVRNAVS